MIGATAVSLIAFEKRNGRIVWELPGCFTPARLSVAVASEVLYFPGALDGAPASPGTLHALDMSSGIRQGMVIHRPHE